jgi:large subunit ribosomal protein L1
VTFECGEGDQEVKAGKVEFRVDKTGIIHAPSAKSNSARSAERNAQLLIDTVIKARPAAVKGKYVKRSRSRPQ